jgi:hypothetical protein
MRFCAAGLEFGMYGCGRAGACFGIVPSKSAKSAQPTHWAMREKERRDYSEMEKPRRISLCDESSSLSKLQIK